MSTEAYTPPSSSIALNAVYEMATNALRRQSEYYMSLMDGKRDIDKECGYPDIYGLTAEAYKEYYDSENIAARVNDIFPDECWKVAPQIYESEDNENVTAFEKAWEEICDKLRGGKVIFADKKKTNPIWEICHRVDKLSGIGFYGVLYLGLNDGLPLDQPAYGMEVEDSDPSGGTEEQYYDHSRVEYDDGVAPKFSGEREILFIRALDETNAKIAEIENDVNNPRYGLPKYYNLTLEEQLMPQPAVKGQEITTQRVHWTRVVHIVDGKYSSEVYGTPRQQKVFKRLVDCRKVYGGSGEGFWKHALPILSFETQTGLTPYNASLSGDDLKQFKEQIDLLMNSLQRYIVTNGMQAKQIAPQISDPSSHIKLHIEGICILLGIPMRIFMGSERGELASTQDKDTWDDRVQSRREGFCTTGIIMPLLTHFVMLELLPEPKEPLTIEWPPASEISESVKADILSKKVEALSKYIGGGVDAIIDPLDFLVNIFGMEEDEAKQILENTMKHLEDANPDADSDTIVPGRNPKPPELDPAQQDPNAAPGQQPKPGQQPPGKPDPNKPKPGQPAPKKKTPPGTTNAGCGAGSKGGGGFKKGNTCSKQVPIDAIKKQAEVLRKKQTKTGKENLSYVSSSGEVKVTVEGEADNVWADTSDLGDDLHNIHSHPLELGLSLADVSSAAMDRRVQSVSAVLPSGRIVTAEIVGDRDLIHSHVKTRGGEIREKISDMSIEYDEITPAVKKKLKEERQRMQDQIPLELEQMGLIRLTENNVTTNKAGKKSSSKGFWRTADDGQKIYIAPGKGVHAGGPGGPLIAGPTKTKDVKPSAIDKKIAKSKTTKKKAVKKPTPAPSQPAPTPTKPEKKAVKKTTSKKKVTEKPDKTTGSADWDMAAKQSQDMNSEWRANGNPKDLKMYSHAKKLSGKYSKEQAASLNEYSSSMYTEINAHLRNGTVSSAKASMQDRIKNVQAAASQKLKEPVVTYRGIDNKRAKALLKTGSMQAEGFVSSSLSKGLASAFAEPGSSSIHLLEIRAKTGASVESISRFPGEFEIVQAHGTKYRVIGSRKESVRGVMKSSNATIITLEEV